jgi:hypothetical protein
MVMKMAVESMEMALGAIPHPGRVPEQRFLSPKTCLRWRRRCRTFHGWRLNDLGFSRRGQYIGERARSVDARGAHTIGLCGQGWARATLWCGHLGAPSVSTLDSVVVSVKMGGWVLVSSNSENISLSDYME